MTFMTGAAANALIRYKDVTIDPTKRNSILQTWGTADEKLIWKVSFNIGEGN